MNSRFSAIVSEDLGVSLPRSEFAHPVTMLAMVAGKLVVHSPPSLCYTQLCESLGTKQNPIACFVDGYTSGGKVGPPLYARALLFVWCKHSKVGSAGEHTKG